MNKTLIAIDPGKCSGFAVFAHDGCVVETGTIRPRGTKGKWYCGEDVHCSRLDAWRSVFVSADHAGATVVIERGFGGMVSAVRSQGMHIGYHQCLCETIGLDRPTEINVAEWRRVIREDLGISWPKDRDACKALSRNLVKEIYNLDLSDDESDAVLLGRAAIRMGMMR